ITGGHGELFWQCFESDGLTPRTAIASTPIADLAQDIEADSFYGTGAEALVTARGAGAAVALYPDAADYALIAGLPPLPPSPIYGRGADAMTLAERAGS
ncbi:MAG: tRNA (adenosine(37)-N6)-threonylcarbamoyltransferase complex dimerization subunit type 1 TsaB, partial [Sphingobium sp.]